MEGKYTGHVSHSDYYQIPSDSIWTVKKPNRRNICCVFRPDCLHTFEKDCKIR